MAGKKQRSKSRRSTSGGTPRNYGDLYREQPTAQASSAVASNEKNPASARSVDWRSEYAYVVGDLRQLFVVSVLVIVAMIAVGFVM